MKSKLITIRKATNHDLKSLHKLGIEEWPSDDWLTDKYIKSSFEQSGVSLCATNKSEIIGGIIIVNQDIVKNWIRYLIVKKIHRNQGIGRLLFEKATKNFKAGESLFVDTGISDKGAIEFYKKMGFIIKGSINDFYKSETAIILKKIL